MLSTLPSPSSPFVTAPSTVELAVVGDGPAVLAHGRKRASVGQDVLTGDVGAAIERTVAELTRLAAGQQRAPPSVVIKQRSPEGAGVPACPAERPPDVVGSTLPAGSAERAPHAGPKNASAGVARRGFESRPPPPNPMCHVPACTELLPTTDFRSA